MGSSKAQQILPRAKFNLGDAEWQIRESSRLCLSSLSATGISISLLYPPQAKSRVKLSVRYYATLLASLQSTKENELHFSVSHALYCRDVSINLLGKVVELRSPAGSKVLYISCFKFHQFKSCPQIKDCIILSINLSTTYVLISTHFCCCLHKVGFSRLRV